MKSAATRIQSVARAAQLLLAAAGDDGIGPTEAAAVAGCSVSTAHHLLSTLRGEGLLIQDPRRRFVLGPGAAVLAEAWARMDRTPAFLVGPLRRLAAETDETAYLAAWRDDAIRVLAVLEGSKAVRVAGADLGTYAHPHARATGKLLLAFADPERRASLLDGASLAAVTPHTITTVVALDLELEAIRARGWAEDREEFAVGVSCVAAPVDVGGIVVASLCVSAPTDRFDFNQATLRDAVLRAAATAARGDRRTATTEEAA